MLASDRKTYTAQYLFVFDPYWVAVHLPLRLSSESVKEILVPLVSGKRGILSTWSTTGIGHQHASLRMNSSIHVPMQSDSSFRWPRMYRVYKKRNSDIAETSYLIGSFYIGVRTKLGFPLSDHLIIISIRSMMGDRPGTWKCMDFSINVRMKSVSTVDWPPWSCVCGQPNGNEHKRNIVCHMRVLRSLSEWN